MSVSASVSVRDTKRDKIFGFHLHFHSHGVFEFLGDHSEGETPVPIPNTEVKPFNADGTAWETVWESRTSPRLNDKARWKQRAFFFQPHSDRLKVVDPWPLSFLSS